MLRFGVRGRSVHLENVDKYFEPLSGFRESCNLSTIYKTNAKHTIPKSRLRCLIDSETRSNGSEGRRSTSTSTSATTAPTPQPWKTCLYDLHVENRGKITNFSGWLLPVQYQEAIAASHQHTRTFASLFDVGHMMQTQIFGKHATEFLESLTTSDLRNLTKGSAVLTVFTNENGGILDDLIVTKDSDDKYFVVSNAGRRNEDTQLLLRQQEWFKEQGKPVNLEFLDPLEQCLVALQGPTAASVLQSIVKIDLRYLRFMNSVETEVLGSPIRITRCGYTGEDGFEISMPAKIARSLVQSILNTYDTKLAGLGARDSLRLEAGLCLYGQDIDENVTPVEAGLTWLVAKRRRAEANFPGAQRILSQIKSGAKKKRVGLTVVHGPPAREGACILTPEGERVGKITSGGPSPTLGRSIAMGYVPQDLAQYGGGVLVEVRGKTYKATITKMPFIKTNYYTAK
ncbi:Aminomethyltransferase, mitochondrial [Eufriesea mexicana]|uniref:Aminomethyltransferase n=1 Tax=Eufriesea mexicana TaxID=516756 RepID=A0A310SFN7_9HYME|nr:PREDICTED: aminomethyltransferase, mitochondrial [Eufriesea mexicana]OAD54280.1 Aminomethyltransferase, mitochondrial [Eufriesea mexicana]